MKDLLKYEFYNNQVKINNTKTSKDLRKRLIDRNNEILKELKKLSEVKDYE